MPKHDYVYVDESGDAAFKLDTQSGKLLSSTYYVAAALHLADDTFRDLNRHVASFRYYSGLHRELKIPARKMEFTRLLDPIRALSEGGKNIWASVVYLDKLRYTGTYLKLGGRRPASPVRFRNYILRRLLEHHFLQFPLTSNQYELVLDRIGLTREDTENLRQYITGNLNIPTPAHVTHASSIYVEGLQVVHHIANGYKDVMLTGSELAELSFVSARDLTLNQSVSAKK